MTTPAAHAIRLYLGELRQLFDSMDPAPFRERDLDPQAAEYIVDSAREAPAGATLALEAQLGREPGTEATAALLSNAVHEYFGRQAASKRRRLRQLLRTGRISLLIGLAFMGLMMMVGEVAFSLLNRESHATFIKESLIIGGWVALWRPAEIFLHEWWPILEEARRYDRLAAMPVTLRGPDVTPEQVA